MKIIICGVGRVGLSIASYLSMHNNDITVIDANPHLLKRVTDTYDIAGILGHASQPDILKKAGAEDADIIIAVTDCDEVNMVACQVAHSVFGIHRKIARIRNVEYRDPAWSNLFSRHHMPIDVIISPEEEIADAIINRMSVPGTTHDIGLIDDHVHVSGIIVGEHSHLLSQKIQDIYYAEKEYEFKIFLILRDNKLLRFDDKTVIEEGDEVYFICRKADLLNLLEDFGTDKDIYGGNIVICGGGVVGQAVASRIQDHDGFCNNNLVMIEQDLEKARVLNRQHKDALIINGSALDYDILQEANVDRSSLFVTVMNSNENNILSAVLAKKMGAHYSIALSNNKLYSQLLPDRIIDAIVNPETVTISKVLQNLRRGNIRGVHAIRDSGAEIIEAVVTEECSVTSLPLSEIKLPDGVEILAVYCYEKSKVIFPTEKTVIRPNDSIVILANSKQQDEIERLFSFSINLF